MTEPPGLDAIRQRLGMATFPNGEPTLLITLERIHVERLLNVAEAAARTVALGCPMPSWLPEALAALDQEPT